MKMLRGVAMILGGVTLPMVVLVSGALATNNMTFQDEVDVEFTFEPTLSVTLGSETIAAEVVPGNYSYSASPLQITVNTNNIAGYTLSAKVGGTGQTAANTNLVNKTVSSATFASLADNASLTLANFGANNWGYAISTTINPASTVFSGLKYNTDKTINATTNMSGAAASGYTGTKVTNFNIGVKAADTQVAGEYTNVITFTVVPNMTGGGSSNP